MMEQVPTSVLCAEHCHLGEGPTYDVRTGTAWWFDIRKGKLFQGMMNDRDKLHPALPGYQVWADALKPIFTELLGPPAREDHAPPATGDPSAAAKK